MNGIEKHVKFQTVMEETASEEYKEKSVHIQRKYIKLQ